MLRLVTAIEYVLMTNRARMIDKPVNLITFNEYAPDEAILSIML